MSFISTAVVVSVLSVSCQLSTAFGPSTCFSISVTRPQHHDIINQRIKLHSRSSDHGSNEETSNKPPMNLSASRKEKRDEEQRRKDRLEEGFATPGLTSAIPGAQDFALDVAKTEREYLQSLSFGTDDDDVIDEYNVDKYVALWTEEGLKHLRMLHFREASESFAKVYTIKPEAYLWQDGLLKYYLGEYHGAAESLAKNAVRYETRFMEPASEERIWRDAAELKIANSLNGGRKMKDAKIPAAMRVSVEEGVDVEQDEKENIESETRKVFSLARKLFSSSISNDSSGESLARAQLQALCGDLFPSSLKSTLPIMPESGEKQQQQQQRTSKFSAQPDRKMYKLHSLFYLGLHYDALGQAYESKQCMKMALKTCAKSISGNNQDITYLLPVMHMTIRDWYDDEEFDEDEDEGALDLTDEAIIAALASAGGVELSLTDDGNGISASGSNANKSEKKEQRLRQSIKDMRVVDLKGELKKRKLKVSGSKKELQDRLIDDLKDDAGA